MKRGARMKRVGLKKKKKGKRKLNFKKGWDCPWGLRGKGNTCPVETKAVWPVILVGAETDDEDDRGRSQ